MPSCSGTYLKLIGGAVSSYTTIESAVWTQESGDSVDGGAFAISAQRLTTALALGSLTPGATYTFRLSATDGEQQSAYGEVKIVINEPPTSGMFSVAPSKG